MTEKDDLIQHILPSIDLFNLLIEQSIYNGLSTCVENDKIIDKELYTSEYIKNIMQKQNITPKDIVHELNKINEPNATYSYVSKICGTNPSRSPTPDIIEAILNNIKYSSLGLRNIFKWKRFNEIVKFLDKEKTPDVVAYSIKYGKEILNNNSIDKIKEAINYVDNESNESEATEDIFTDIPDTNLKILVDNIDMFLNWDNKIWDILELICDISINDFCLFKDFILENSQKITLKTIANNITFIKEFLCISFEKYNYSNLSDKQMSIELIITKIEEKSPELLYTFHNVFSKLYSQLWELALEIYILDSNITLKREPSAVIKKKTQDLIKNFYDKANKRN